MGKDKDKNKNPDVSQALTTTAPGLIDGGSMVVSKKSKKRKAESSVSD